MNRDFNRYTVSEFIGDWLPWHWLKHRCPAGHVRRLPPGQRIYTWWYVKRHANCRPAP